VVAQVIDYVEFAVDDLEEAKAFYGSALGWTFNDYGLNHAGIQDPTRPGGPTRTGAAASS
jgi:predicted enzyme related to lactoylglutathione lyase